MKRLLLATALVCAIGPALAGNVSISVGQPGFFGHIDIGDYPQPQLIYRQPVLIGRAPMEQAPIYLNVPPGHAKDWRKHCRQYNACDERVYFVQNSWYDREYVPRYEAHHRDQRDGRDEGHGGWRGEDRGGDNRGGGHNGHGNDGEHGRGNNR